MAITFVDADGGTLGDYESDLHIPIGSIVTLDDPSDPRPGASQPERRYRVVGHEYRATVGRRIIDFVNVIPDDSRWDVG
jgi:hypothetical protein